jgi:hypothetical protein
MCILKSRQGIVGVKNIYLKKKTKKKQTNKLTNYTLGMKTFGTSPEISPQKLSKNYL